MGVTIHSPSLLIWKLESHLWRPWLWSLQHTPNLSGACWFDHVHVFSLFPFPFASPLPLCEGFISCGGKSHHIPESKYFPSFQDSIQTPGHHSSSPQDLTPTSLSTVNSPIVSSALAMPDHSPFPFQNMPNYVPHSLTRQLFLCYIGISFPYHIPPLQNIPSVPWSPAQMPQCLTDTFPDSSFIPS